MAFGSFDNDDEVMSEINMTPVFWNNQPVDEATLQADIEKAAQQQPQPEMHLRADRSVRYERVAQVMAAIQRGGLARIGFVTEPQRN